MEEERLLKEKLLVEKAMNEKLEREKEYLARKHELLRQQDEDAASVRSGRSQASSRQKVEAWFKQQLMSEDSPSDGPNKRSKFPDQTTGPVGSSTPVEISKTVDVDLSRAPRCAKENVDSIPRTTDSISIGDSSKIDDDGNQRNVQQQLNPGKHSDVSNLALVDIRRYDRILEEANPTNPDIAQISKPSDAGMLPRIVPKLIRNPLPYTIWHRETKEIREQHAREQQYSDKREDLQQREQRERELFQLLRQSEEQREQDRQRLQEIEAILKRQHDIDLQHQKENDIRRKRELDLINRLKLFEQQYAQEKAMRDEEKQKYLATEQQLTEQLEFMRLGYGQISTSGQHTNSPVSEHQDLAVSNNPLTATVSESQFDRMKPNQMYQENPNRATSRSGIDSHYKRVGTPTTPIVTPKIGPPFDSLEQSHFVNNAPANMNLFEPIHPLPLAQGPTPHQLAARQVISRELPVFAGDPIEWPLFISSYNHSTEACGYSNSENLLRLQRSLKGAAKEAVSSFLLHPSTVPDVLSTLQTLYGRPEQIVHNLIA